MNFVALWQASDETVQLLAHRQFDKLGLAANSKPWLLHQQLLMGIIRHQKSIRIQSAATISAGTNPLNLELFCIPITTTNGTHFVVEVFATPSDSVRVAKQRLARLELLCEYFRDYLQSQELRLRADHANAESALRSFVSQLNAAKTSRELAVVAVNAGRQVIGCDRVSLGWISKRQPQIMAVSGLDAIDPRSNVIQSLTDLTRVAIRSGYALQKGFSSDSESPDHKTSTSSENSPAPRPSVYQTALDSYPQTNRPRQIVVIPLGDPSPKGLRQGALIIEQFHDEPLSSAAIQRAGFVAENVRPLLERLELLENIPFASWWAKPSRGRWWRRTWRAIALAALRAGLGWGALQPLDLRLPANGELLAETRHAVFAPENGVVREVLVDHGSRVKAGDPLVRLDNLDLSAQLRDLTGQLVKLRDRQRSLEARRSARLTERDQIELQSDLVEVATSTEHTERQIKLLQERLDRLQIVAPADGVVTSWNLKQTLLHRTVLPGDALLQEIEPSGAWRIELQVPEDRVGYISRSLSELPAGQSLPVEFVLATEPEHRYSGQLRSLGARTELTGDGHIVRAVIELDPNHRPPLRDGAEVKARLHCGPQPAGFVLFRELIEVIQTYWWY